MKTNGKDQDHEEEFASKRPTEKSPPPLRLPSACRTAASQQSDVECKQAIEVK